MNGPTLKRKRLVASHYRRRPPLILVTNDDGIDAPGLIALVKAMKRLGDVVVVAPIREQSAVGHSITLRNDIHTKSHKYVGDLAGIQAVAIDGTPVDCAKLALSSLLTRRPDLTVSGINKGSNMAVNVMYSGTVSAATETSLHGIDSLAFSLVESPTGEYDFSAAALYASGIGDESSAQPLATGYRLEHKRSRHSIKQHQRDAGDSSCKIPVERDLCQTERHYCQLSVSVQGRIFESGYRA